MRSWIAKKILTRNLERLHAGDPGPLLSMYASDVRFRFPGTSSWATDIQGKEKVEQWLWRFIDAGIRTHLDEVVVKGPLWKMTLCMRSTDHLTTPEDGTVYENRYVIWGHLVWGKLKDYEVYEDTERSLALDDYLAEKGKLPAAA